MADSDARVQRATALEEKRRKLDDLKKRREVRGLDTARVHASAAANLDDYIDDLLKVPEPVSIDSKGTSTAISATSASEIPVDPQSQNHDKANYAGPSSNVTAVSVPKALPKVVETFSVSTQTEEYEDAMVDDVDEEEGEETVTKTEGMAKTEHNVENVVDANCKFLTPKEVEKEVGSKPFVNFINTVSKKVERVLGSPLITDFMGEYNDDDNDAGRSLADTTKESHSKFIQTRQVYECSIWTSGRDVTDMDWSPIHRELLLSTHHMNMSTTSTLPTKGHTAVSAVAPTNSISSSLTPRSGELQSDGLALIWSLSMPNRPEHIVTCGSPVMTGRFHPTNAKLVIGGCESGQVVVWDLRSGRLPVQKSALSTVAGASSKGHTHPIGSMEIVEGSSGMVTTSTDGRVNFWSLSNLRDPVESISVGDSVSCVAVAPESESLLMGDENGALYSVSATSQSASGQRTSRRQVRKLETTDADGENFGHYGMVTSLSTKILQSGTSARTAGLSKGFIRGIGGLVLTSGVDWTVKLWAPAYTDKPLLSLVSHSYDYMSDVAWSPTHPSLFATASSNGGVELWNLAVSFEEPVTGPDGITVEPDAMAGRGLNKLKWSTDGRRVAVASSDRVHLLSLSEDAVRVTGDEDSKVMNHLLSRGQIERK